MEKIPSNFNKEKTENTLRVENTIRELVPIDELIKIFGKDTYLKGHLLDRWCGSRCYFW